MSAFRWEGVSCQLIKCINCSLKIKLKCKACDISQHQLVVPATHHRYRHQDQGSAPGQASSLLGRQTKSIWCLCYKRSLRCVQSSTLSSWALNDASEWTVKQSWPIVVNSGSLCYWLVLIMVHSRIRDDNVAQWSTTSSFQPTISNHLLIEDLCWITGWFPSPTISWLKICVWSLVGLWCVETID